MSIDEAHNEVRIGWANSYSPEAIEKAVDALNDKPLGYRINILIARLCFRGIYFPSMGSFAWVRTILENRQTIIKLLRQGFGGGLRASAPSVNVQPVTRQRSGNWYIFHRYWSKNFLPPRVGASPAAADVQGKRPDT
jgi:hypothetical protein